MKSEIIYDKGHQWVVFGRDPEKPDSIIDTNQYLIKEEGHAVLLDPGGIEIFAPMLAAILHHVNIDDVKDLFASHQDPDIISSLNLWDKAVPEANLHAPWLWEGFIRHFGCENISYIPVPDEGSTIKMKNTELQLIPAHYLHSSGNFNIYDPQAKILMSGDIGAALESAEAPMFVEDFKSHIPKMKMFHQRWMPSNNAKNNWVSRVRKLNIDIMAPQHGRMFKGDDIQRFLDWFEELEVGTGYKT